MKIKNIAVLGTGGVGGYFGGKICHYFRNNHDVKIHFLARGKHLDEIKKNGLKLTTDTDGEIICRPDLATDKIDDFPSIDLALVCVKSYDLNDVLKNVRNKLHENTVLLPLLNGIDIKERIKKIIPDSRIFPGFAFIVTHIENPGHILQNGSFYKLAFMSDHTPEGNLLAEDISSLLEKSEIHHEYKDDVTKDIWEKFMFIAPFGLVTAAYDKTFGEIMESEKLVLEVKAVMNEIFHISVAMGINLSVKSPHDAFEKGRKLPHETKTSFQRDFENRDKPDERDLFGGVLIRLGEKYGIDVPAVKKLYSELFKIKP